MMAYLDPDPDPDSVSGSQTRLIRIRILVQKPIQAMCPSCIFNMHVYWSKCLKFVLSSLGTRGVMFGCGQYPVVEQKLRDAE